METYSNPGRHAVSFLGVISTKRTSQSSQTTHNAPEMKVSSFSLPEAKDKKAVFLKVQFGCCQNFISGNLEVGCFCCHDNVGAGCAYKRI